MALKNSRPVIYNNNRNLKAAGVPVQYTQWEIQEYVKCAQDPIYFIETYAKIISLDKGIVPFKLYPYQKRIINAFHNNRKIIAKVGRQLGKSSVIAGYFAWYILFNDNKTAVILGNKQATAVEIFSRVQFTIENVPHWLQQGIIEWNKKSLVLENGSKCFAAATSPSACRSFSINLLLVDEMAFLGSNLASEFIASVFPTISSSKSSKIAIVSTPNGLNHYHKLWVDAENGVNGFIPVSGHWTEHPDRDQAWADEQKGQLGEVRYNQEVEAQFLGSSYTLIDGVKIGNLVYENPLYENNNLELFEKPMKDHTYVITVDVSRGKHQDFSAFAIFDITSMPYKVVGTYKDNTISTLEYPHLIYNAAMQYNKAFVLIEVNDLGEEVSNIMWYDYEYENLYFTQGNKLSQAKGYPGVRTTTKVKGLGCSVLKELIEKDQLLVTSHRIIEELGLFVLSKKSYASEDKIINDDLCTCLWLFAWLSQQTIFQEINDNDLRKKLTDNNQRMIDESMTPFGYFLDGKENILKSNEKLPSGTYFELTSDQIELLNF